MRQFIFILLLFWGSEQALAQSKEFQILGKAIHRLKQPVELNLLTYPRFLPLHTSLSTIVSTKNAMYPEPKTFTVSEQYYEHLGFFCKAELRLEQASRMPIKIRLGEVQYVERMEGKYK